MNQNISLYISFGLGNISFIVCPETCGFRLTSFISGLPQSTFLGYFITGLQYSIRYFNNPKPDLGLLMYFSEY